MTAFSHLKKIACALAFTALAACTTNSLEELRRTTPTENPYLAALSAEYLAFAESEARQYDWASSQHFADKGLAAAYGHEVEPETFDNWDIGEDYIQELANARLQLITLLTPDVKVAKPGLSARALFYYDCWMEQQNEAWQEDDISSCREGFYHSIRILAGAPEEPEEATPLIFSSSYLIFFEWNKWAVNEEGMKVVNSTVQDLKDSKETEYEVVLNGHADRSGDVEYNLKLSQKRAEAVKAELVKRGIPDERIRYFAFGETDNRIPTADGIRERANRRVEIFFNQ
ncbi:MAG: OmpA family protein [Alphaproteobacteria bacterium]|nr:OmpA family protein [Alphaproteobacteria bacterium]